MKKVITFTLFLFIGLCLSAQTPQVLFYGYIEEGVFVDPTGDVKKSKRQKAPEKLKNVKVFVYKGGDLINTVSARETGFYALLLDAGSKYSVTFEKDGYFCKTFEIDCSDVKFHGTDAAMKCLTDVSLFKKVDDDSLLSLCKEPFAKCTYQDGEMVWDIEYTEKAKEKFYELAQPYYMAQGK
ncbi:MAG: hypothetical protein K1X54_04430 [Flavobacteriales bacterium]|nr:hypothetical protein [Flavobacteriales bacterium]